MGRDERGDDHGNENGNVFVFAFLSNASILNGIVISICGVCCRICHPIFLGFSISDSIYPYIQYIYWVDMFTQ